MDTRTIEPHDEREATMLPNTSIANGVESVVCSSTRQSLADLRVECPPGHSMIRHALHFVAIARPHHYCKNILVVLGAALAFIYQPDALTTHLVFMLGWGLISTCLLASSNYVLNEILDAKSDRFHTAKRERPMAAGSIAPTIALIEWFLLGAAGLLIAASVGSSFFGIAISFQLMSVAYNVPPIRLKDIPYLDVLSEAANSPLRLLLGWLIVSPSEYPELSMIIAFWMAGAFAMARKRLIEYRFFQDASIAAAYRKSFAHYNEHRLKLSMSLYASTMLIFGLNEFRNLWPMLGW